MIYLFDLQLLLAQWTERMNDNVYAKAYRDAMSDCIFDLTMLLDSRLKEEAQAREFFDQQRAEAIEVAA